MGPTMPWQEEWVAYQIETQPEFAEMYDESVFADELQDIGGWYLDLDQDSTVIVCLDRDRATESINTVLCRLAEQGLQVSLVAVGRGFARRDSNGGTRLYEYRLEVGDRVYQQSTGNH